MSQKLPLRTNVPRIGVITGAWYAKGNYGDQIKIAGRWEGEGDGHFYLPLAALDAFTDAGVLAPDGASANGEPRYRVLTQARVSITRKEESVPGGLPRRTTEVAVLDPDGNVLSPQPRDGDAAPAAGPNAPTAADETSPEERLRRRWAELDERYAAALAIAGYRLREVLGQPPDPATLQAGAATVLIAADRSAMEAFPGLARSLRSRLTRRSSPPRTAHTTSATAASQPVAAGHTELDEEFDPDELPF